MFKLTMMLSLLAGFVVKCDDNNYYIVEVSKEAERIRRPFYIYWNVPTIQCKSKGIHFAGLYEKFGIIQNGGDHFLGDKMVILYDPGLFPALFKNESDGKLRFRNGGVPQEGNLTEHVLAFERSVAHSIPDENYDGVAVIDFESWRPIFKQNYGVLTPYKDISYELERKRHPWWLDQWVKHEAERRFEDAGRKFMEVTLTKAKLLRSKARWGYYGFPYCFNADHRDQCSKDTTQENDQCHWLWSKSDALFPSVYSSKSLSTEQLKTMIKGRVKEASRLVEKSAGILPYVWFRQRDGDYFNERDLKAIFNTIYNTEGSSGVVIWGSSNDVNTRNKCENLYEYIYTKFGPLVSKFAKYDNRLEENKVTEDDYLVNDTNTAETNIVKETTTVKNSEVEFVINLQEGPEGTINVVQPIEAVQNNGNENSNISETKPIPIESSNVTSGQIVVSNQNKPDSEALILFQQLNGLTIIDLLNKMFGKNVKFPNGTNIIGETFINLKGKAEVFAQDTKQGETKNAKANDVIEIKDIFDINSDESHILTTEQCFDYDFTTQNPDFETTTQQIEDIGAIEKGVNFIDNVADVFQNMHNHFEKVTTEKVIETSTKIQNTNTELKDSIFALKEVFSELRHKNLTLENGDLFSFLDNNDNPVEVTTSTTEVPETFDVLRVITEANDIYFNEIPQNFQTFETVPPIVNEQEKTTEINSDLVRMFIPTKDRDTDKTDQNQIFTENNIHFESTTPEIDRDIVQNINNDSFETTQNAPVKDSESKIYENMDQQLVSTTEDSIISTTSQYLNANIDNLELSNTIFSTTEKYESPILNEPMSTDTPIFQEITTEKEFGEFGNNLIPLKDPGDIANNDSTTQKENYINFETSTSKHDQVLTENYDTTTNEARKQNFYKVLTKKKYKVMRKFLPRTTTSYETTEHNNYMHRTRKNLKDIRYLIYKTEKYNFESTTSQYTNLNLDNTDLARFKAINKKERRKNYIFSDLILNNNENFNWLANNYIPQGFASRTNKNHQETTTYKNIFTNIPGSEEEDIIIKNFLNEYDTAAGHPLADLMKDMKIKSDETLVNDPEFAAVLSKEVQKLKERGYNLNFNEKPVLYDTARRDLAIGVNKSNHFLYPYKTINPEETTTYIAYYTDNPNNVYYEKEIIEHLANKYANTKLDRDLAENNIDNIYSEEFKINNTRKSRTLNHNASYPYSLKDKNADKNIEYNMQNDLEMENEGGKNVKRDVVYDRSELTTNFNRNSESLTSTLDLDKPYNDAVNSCNQNSHIFFPIVFLYTIAMCLCELSF